ncbi:MAG: cbb3-type cytochrome c oxidase subunit II [Planctomycetota bacterium]|jgi:cbb3-type cytochrome c oxidase subunit II
MTLDVLIGGALLLFAAIVAIAVVLPALTAEDTPSAIHRPRTELENRGREIFIANGCTYCHSMYVRPQDWGLGAQGRVAEAGDYVDDQPHLLGSERTGPDLSQAGGEHPDDWHRAHFENPRFTRPESIMPPFAFLEEEGIVTLTAFVQSLGYKEADARMTRQRAWQAKAKAAYAAGVEANIRWLHDHVPEGWRKEVNPYPSTPVSLARGKRIYQGFCIGCHGPVGDGAGPATPFLDPPPLNFTELKGRGWSGGIFYYQIMNGITGTAMPYFKRELESEKIWDVGEYVARYFVGETDANRDTGGIDAAYEGPRRRKE